MGQSALRASKDVADRRPEATAIDLLLEVRRRTPPGHLACVDVALAGVRRFAGECLWSAPEDTVRLFGQGTALRLSGEQARRFPGDAIFAEARVAASPLAFFLVSPADTDPEADLWIPRVVVRASAEGVVVTLAAMADATPEGVLAGRLDDDLALVFSPSSAGPRRRSTISVTSTDAAVWCDRVRRTTAAIEAGAVEKVVLARRSDAVASEPIDPAGLAARLGRDHPTTCVFALPLDGGRLVAASPERLLVRRGDRVFTDALAGTGTDDEALLASAKDRREHAIVVDHLRSRLSAVCDAIEVADEPSIMALPPIRHLWTRLSGRLRPTVGFLEAVLHLHPSPAVLGAPPDAARRWLTSQGERRDAGYTGVAGWIDRDGDGDAAVVLRSVHLVGRRAVLWAGAGIVAGSDPDAEWAETVLKASTLLRALEEA